MSVEVQDAIGVVVVEDHHLTRFGVQALVEAAGGMHVLASLSSGEEALAWASTAAAAADVWVIDLQLPGLSGVDLIATLKGRDPEVRILVLTAFQQDENVSLAMGAGALGYITKAADGEELLAAMRCVASGKKYLPPEIAATLNTAHKTPALTNRELEVLREVCAGRSNRAIAQALGLTEKTAGFYVGNVMAKLGAKTRSEAIGIAFKRGLHLRFEEIGKSSR